MSAELLEAGAVLPADSVKDDDDRIDVLTTRTYRHPVLGDRVVVRPVPRTLGGAEDLTMEFLGFEAPERVVEVGVVRQRALGFPAWALVHDPANGHHALALVKEIERLARLAHTRVGPAKDGFDALGERLARSVPHFLPTFYEQAGRAFLAASSSTYAATMFGKAREAERVYALGIDEERQHVVFLEFALAGALTAKALSAHARDLAARSAPEAAYEQFRRLCVERTLGGLPPYAAMHTDLRRLAKKAKLVEAEADEAVLADLLEAPALTKAPASFWTAYQAPLTRLAQRDARLRGRLLTFFPEHCPEAVWLSILDGCDALAAVTGPADAVPAEARPTDGPAGWLARLVGHRNRRYWSDRHRIPELLALVERMAGRLIADAAPVAIAEGGELDLLDLCLALGVPVADPEREHFRLHVTHWLGDEAEGRRDLVALAADPRFLTPLAQGVEQHVQSNRWEAEGTRRQKVQSVLAVPGLRTALEALLAENADTLIRQGLPSLGRQLGRMGSVAFPEAFAVNPAAVRRVVEHDIAAVLGRTLRAGVLDEYGWPALEEAATRLREVKLKQNDDEDIQSVVQWPHFVLKRGQMIVVVGPEKVEYEHLARTSSGPSYYSWRQAMRWVGGQLLFSWYDDKGQQAYWTGNPTDVFTVDGDGFGWAPVSLELPGVGRTTGGRPLRVGDRREETAGPVATDGTNYWVLVDRETWHEFDPATGERGRASVPGFFDAGATGDRLVQSSSSLLPAPIGAEASPLGVADGMVGWRLRGDEESGRYTGTGVDGRSFTVDGSMPRRAGVLVGAVRFPGSDELFGLFLERSWRSQELLLVAPDGTEIGAYQGERNNSAAADMFSAGTPMLPPAELWHLLRPRDEAGSAALRGLTDEQARQLLEGAVTALGTDGPAKVATDEDDEDDFDFDDDDDDEVDEAAAAGADATMAKVRALVSRVVPAVTDPNLIAGVAGVVLVGARHWVTQFRFGEVLSGEVTETPVSAATPTAGPAADSLLAPALKGFLPYCYERGDSALRLVTQAAEVLVAGADPAGFVAALGAGDLDWLDALGAVPAMIYRAALPVTPPQQREALLILLEAISAGGLLAAGSRLRTINLEPDAKKGTKKDKDGPTRGTVIENGSRRLAVLSVDSDGELRALEYAPDGKFGPVRGYKITSERVYSTATVPSSTVDSFVTLLRDNGPIAWDGPKVEALSAAAGMSRAEAALILAGLPRGDAGQEAWAETRESLGLSLAVWRLATQRWDALPDKAQVDAVAALIPADPAALWATGPDVAALAAWWTDRHGRRKPVPDELILELDKNDVTGSMPASEFIHGIANPDTCRWLAGAVPDVDDDDVFTAVAQAVPWLAYHLPATDPVRDHLPTVVASARKRLLDPATVLEIGWHDGSEAAKLVKLLPKPEAVEFPADWDRVKLWPGRLSGPDDPTLAVLRTKLDDPDEGVLASVRTLLGEQLATTAAYRVPAEVADFPHDPGRAVPGLVAEVADRHGISADAATLYLQLLALPDPTDKNVAAWTGWKPARLKAARAELAATDLVVEAKRARAGRSLFLPGGWLALKAPYLPVERWKIPLLNTDEDGDTDLAAVIPIAPPPLLFDLAWTRVREGDHPRFDELVTERRR